MTSMPASRNARAITFAPRSWPSRPGLATRTRIFCSLISSLRDENAQSYRLCNNQERQPIVVHLSSGADPFKLDSGLFVDSVDVAQCRTDFAEGCVSAYRFDRSRHGVFVEPSGLSQAVEGLRDGAVVSLGACSFQPLQLVSAYGF